MRGEQGVRRAGDVAAHTAPTRPHRRWVDRLRPVLAVAAGLLLVASLPLPGWWPAAILGVACLSTAVAGAPLAQRAAAGALAGLALYGLGLRWALVFTTVGYALALLVETAILALAVAAVHPRRVLAGLPAALVLAEATKLRWPFGGLAVTELALGQVGGPLADAARLGGPLLVLLLTSALGAAVGLAARRPAAWRPLLACSAVVVLTVAVAAVAPRGADLEQVRVAVVQGGGPRTPGRVRTSDEGALARHLAVARGVSRPVDLVLLPEDVVDDRAPLERAAALEPLARLARRLDAVVVAGAVELLGDRRYRNAALAYAPDGQIADRFDKVHRVPFGEYVPLPAVVRLFHDLDNTYEELAGSGPGILDTSLGRLGVAISYEAWFPDRVREAVAEGASIVLAPTKVNWFREATVPAQAVATARLRAIETGRVVLLSSHASYSAIVGPSGRLLARSEMARSALLQAEVTLRGGTTPYVAAGDLPVLLACVFLLGGGWLADRRGRALPALRHPGSHPGGRGEEDGGQAAGAHEQGPAQAQRDLPRQRGPLPELGDRQHRA